MLAWTDVSIDRPVAGDGGHCPLPLYAESSEHPTSSNLQKMKSGRCLGKKMLKFSADDRKPAFLTDELVPDSIPLLEVRGTVDDAVNEGQYGRFMGDSLSSLQFVDHGTKSVGLVCFPLKCEDSVITQHFTEVTC